MAKKALISGSSGFIGKHLWDTFIEKDIEPIALERDMLYAHVPQLIEVLHYHKPNYIVHLASYGNHRGQLDSTKTIMGNYWTTYNLLKASEFLDYEAFINVASSSCYGVKQGPMNEFDSMYPDTLYASTKVGGLQLARAFAKQYNKPVMTVVPFSIYGEGEASFRFIPTVIKHLVTKESMQLNQGNTHDWTYANDFIEGVLLAIENIDKLKGQLLNIGRGVATSNADVVSILEDISGKKLKYEAVNNPNPFDSPLWYADNTKLLKLGWKAKYGLKQGIVKCWDYYSKLYV